MRLIRASSAAVLLFLLAGWRVAADDTVFFMELPRDVLPATIGSNAFAIAGSYYSGGGSLQQFEFAGGLVLRFAGF